jgi:crotonobetainyl-CoA:carnitine CoA-transferase CaiB-like acyl-CoA transferase
MLGADVTRVEAPGGDPARRLRPLAGGQGAGYLAYNRGKQVLEIDYKRPEGRAAFLELARDADVFVHSWPAGRGEALGLSFADLSRVNPRIVACGISAWRGAPAGAGGVATEYFVQAVTGCGDGLTPSGQPPATSLLILSGVMTGLLCCEAVLTALLARESTGRGARLETSLFCGAMTLQAQVLDALADGTEDARRLGRPVWGALDVPVPTASGYLMLSPLDVQTRHRVGQLCGVSPARPDVDEAIARALGEGSAAEWEPLLADAGLSCATVRNDLSALPLDPAMGGLLEPVAGSCWAPASPWRFSP